MLQYPKDPQDLLSLSRLRETREGQFLLQFAQSEKKRLMEEGFKNTQRIERYGGAVDVLNDLAGIIEGAWTQYELIKNKGRK